MTTDSKEDCHLCHLHDHGSPSSLLRTSALRDSSPKPARKLTRSGSMDAGHYDHHRYHDHHHHDHHRHHHTADRRGRSRLSRLADHPATHSLPASRSGTLNLYPEQVSVLPDGGHRYLGGDRASVRSLDLGNPRFALDNRSHYSLKYATLQAKQPYSSQDHLNILPSLRASRHSLASLANPDHRHSVPPGSDFLMSAGRYPFLKSKFGKSRFNLQTFLMIGCYTLLFAMAVIIGSILIYQNGIIGARQTANNIQVPSGNANTEPSASGPPNSGVGGKFGKILEAGSEGRSNVPVHNVVQVTNPSAPNVNAAGTFGFGNDPNRPRSISGSIPSNRPVQNFVGHQGVLQSNSPNTNQNIAQQFHPTHHNSNSQFNGFLNTPSTISHPNVQSHGNIINNGHPSHHGGQSNVPVPAILNSNTDPNNVHFHENIFSRNPSGNGNFNTQTQSGHFNLHGTAKTQAATNGQQGHSKIANPNHNLFSSGSSHGIVNGQRVIISSLPTASADGTPSQHFAVNPAQGNQKIIILNDPSKLNFNPSQTATSTAPKENTVTSTTNPPEALGDEKNQKKIKMLNEILNAEGSAQLMKDLITLKNNKDSISAISQKVSDVTQQNRNEDAVKGAVTITTKVPEISHTTTVSTRATLPPIQQVTPEPPKKKTNIQLVREVLASLVNSPEVQQILRDRATASSTTPSPSQTVTTPRNKGDEMRAILLRALAKQLPNSNIFTNSNTPQRRPAVSIQSQSSQVNPTADTRAKQLEASRSRILAALRKVRENNANILQRNVIQSRIGAAQPRTNFRRVEPQNVRRHATRRTSRGRPSVQNSSQGNQNTASLRDRRSQSAVERRPPQGARGTSSNRVSEDVLRHWRRMDDKGTMSQGTVRQDGSFAFTNCRPAEMCKHSNIHT